MGNSDLKFSIGFDLKKGVDDALREGDKFLRRMDAEFARRAVRVRFELNTRKFEGIEEVRRRLAQLKIEPITPETKSAIRELTQELQQLAKALEAVQKYSARAGGTAEAVRNSKVALNEQRAAAAHELARQRAARAAIAEEKLAQARVRSTAAINMQARAYTAQHEALGRLTHILQAYASFRMVGGFLSQIRETTAEFELQRVSLGAIIQDQQRANQLFSELKSFALQSPLKILDLTKYTKQVAAYGIETEKLFDTTKRLADVSVGLGVDLGRLVLAYGQVKAASYLRAAEIRQFTEAGIPMLDLLAKKFTDLQGKMVSTEQVMDLVSKRVVSFSMVEEIFNDMTSAGGMFYNMQEKQAQTLFGMWSKLGDAAAIMYNEIGNTGWVNAGMKTTIGLLESMMRNWKTSAKVLSTAGVSLAVYVVGLKNASIASKALSLAEATTLATQKARIINTPKLVMAILGQNRAITATILLEQAYTKAAIKANTATNLFTKGFWKLTAALLANPFVAVAAAIAGVVATIIHFRGNAETAAERAEQLNKSVSSMKNLKGTTQPLIDAYNDLIKKTERTTEEQKKLSAVTHELAKQYPGAVKAVGDFGEEIELAADKLNLLYQAEKEARMENTRHELEETEKQIAEVEEAIERLQQKISDGGYWRNKQVWTRIGYMKSAEREFVPWSSKEKAKILDDIDVLRYGEDGQGGLKALKDEAAAARKELEDVPGGRTDVSGFKGGDRTKSDPRLSILQGIANKMAEVNKEYDELLKKEGQTQALADTQKLFASSFKQMEATAKKYGFKLPTFEVPQTIEDVQKWYKAIMDNIKRLNLKNADKVLIELGFKSDKAAIDKQQKDIEKQIKVLADRISRTKTAKEFYDKVLGMTGDYQLSANLTVSVYGQNGRDLQDAIREQIRTAFETDPEKNVTIDLSEAIDPDTGAINYNKLAELEEKYKDVLISGRADLRQKLIDEGRKTSAAQAQQWLKDIEKAKDFAQQRIDLATYTANQIAAINARTDLPQADKDKLTKGYQDREAKQLAKLQYDEFKDSAMYVHIFEDLDHASTTALKNMRDRLVALKGQWQNLDPTQVKELTKAIADLDERIAGRNPFKWIVDGFKGLAAARPQKVIDAEMIAATDELAKREDALTAATQKLTEAQTAQVNAQAEVAQARQDLEDALAVSGGEETSEVKAAREVLGIKIATFNAVKAASADSIATAKTEVDKASEKYEEQKKVIDKLVEEGNIREANIKKIELSIQKIDEYQQQINEALGGIRKIMEAFGTSDEDMQFFDDVTGALNEIVNAGQDAATSVGAFMTGDIFTGITKGVSAIGGLVSGFIGLFTAGRVRRANKEIKRQQELLDQLDYTYGRLEKAADKVFGSDYISNYNQRLQNLQAQQAAYEKQAQAERSKGKKEDKKKTEEYLKNARETADEIAEMQSELRDHFLGTDIASAARDFASAWIDAKTSFADTTDAMRAKFKDMVQNMIIEAMAAKIMENALQPFYKAIDEAAVDGDITADEIAEATKIGLGSIEDMNKGMEIVWAQLKQAGLDVGKIWSDAENGYTGIAKNVASATSEEINANTAALNTQNYYMSHVPQIAEHVAAMRQLMERANTTTLPEASAAGWTDWQKQAMDNYNAIARNTAETVAECRRSAAACEAFAADIHRMIDVSGGKHRLNVKL